MVDGLRRLLLDFEELEIVQALISAQAIDQLVMGADVGDPALLENDDAGGAAHGREPMGDHEHGSVLHQILERLLHQRLRFRIERRGRFIEDEDGRVLQQRARDRKPLPFSSGEAEAPLADHRVVTLGHALNELMRERRVRRLFDLRASERRDARRRCCCAPYR